MVKKPREFNSLEETLSSLSVHPLFSTLITFYTLLIIYLPSLFLKILFSPLLISAAILLLTLLRLGATQKELNESQIGSSIPSENESSAAIEETTEFSFPEKYAVTRTSILLENHESKPACVDVAKTSATETEMGFEKATDFSFSENYTVTNTITISQKNQESGPDCAEIEMGFYGESFVEWDVRAPLEVIHEEYEGEGDERNDDVTEPAPVSSIERYASLSLYYPESDSDGSSDEGVDFAGIGGWDSPESTCFKWDEEEEKGEEELIEIAFDEKGRRSGVVDQYEEENMIEINIFPARVEAVGGEG